MVICLVALVVFGVLGLFSARYRRIAKEAFECVGRRIILKPCESKLDQRIRAKLTAKILKRSPKAARFVYKNFEALSWVFTIIFFLSMGYTFYSLYNLAVYGSCDPHSNNCIFRPGALTCGSEHCETEGCTCKGGNCTSPNYTACEGNCTCRQGTCG